MLTGLLFLVVASIIAASCNKKFDAPPAFVGPEMQANITIKDLKTRHTMGKVEQITEDLIVEGVVVADDKSGNFYKSIAIQDATGGITVRLDGSNLNTSYPVGRKIYIKLKGLFLGDYNKLYQIGGSKDESDPERPELLPLASNLFDTYIVKGSTNNPVTPTVVNIADLDDRYQSMLIQINNAEFIPSDTSKTYADAVGKTSVNLTVKSCDGGSIIVRTSGYANFASTNVPNDKGTLLAIYTIFGTTKQLVIRDASDVRFNDARCAATPTTEMNIADLRALFTVTPPATVAIPDARKIKGVVISDRSAKNINDRNVIIQQGDNMSGIMVRFDATHSFDLGDLVEVNVSGQSLEEFNGTLQVNNVPLANANKVGTGTISPRVTTIAQALANFEAWESTLIKIDENVTLSGSSTGYSGLNTFKAGTNEIKTFVLNSATFAGTTYPTSVTSIIGYLNQGGSGKTQQLLIRSENDVVGGTTPPPPPPVGEDLIISEYVEGSSNNKYLEIYNAGTTTADLSKYTLKLYANGNTTPVATSGTQVLSALASGPSTLAPGETLVLKHQNAALTLPAGVTAYVTGVVNFNGDDVVELEKDGVVIDVFGKKGERPTTPVASWTIAGDTGAALDKTVRRKADVKKGTTDWEASAGTNPSDSQWEVAGKDDVSNLGTR